MPAALIMDPSHSFIILSRGSFYRGRLYPPWIDSWGTREVGKVSWKYRGVGKFLVGKICSWKDVIVVGKISFS